MTEFRLLGSLEAVDSGRSLALGGHRQRAVLAVLLLRHGEVVSVDAIVDAVWGEQVPKTAVAYLQNCISRLRTQLGYETIETRAPGYALRVDVEAGQEREDHRRRPAGTHGHGVARFLDVDGEGPALPTEPVTEQRPRPRHAVAQRPARLRRSPRALVNRADPDIARAPRSFRH